MTTVPVCPNCHHAAEFRIRHGFLCLHDLRCRKCGLQMITMEELDRLVWVDRSEIDWHPPPEDNR